MSTEENTTNESARVPDPTLNSIRERWLGAAIDKNGDMWQWNQPQQFFMYGTGDDWWLATAKKLVDATSPGYFTRWATEEEVEAA